MKNRFFKEPCEPFSKNDRISLHQLIKKKSALVELLTFYFDEASSDEAREFFKANPDIANALFEQLRKILGKQNAVIYFDVSRGNDEWMEFLTRSVTEIDSRKKIAVYTLNNKKKERGPLLDLLRHIRNSLAHAHLYVQRHENYFRIMFEDQSPDKSQIRARIVLNHSTLKKWMVAIYRCFAENGLCLQDTKLMG